MSFLLASERERMEAPATRVRELMRAAAKLWDETVRETVPQDMLELLARLK